MQQSYTAIVEGFSITTHIPLSKDGSTIHLCNSSCTFMEYLVNYAESGVSRPRDGFTYTCMKTTWDELNAHQCIHPDFISTVSPVIHDILGGMFPKTAIYLGGEFTILENVILDLKSYEECLVKILNGMKKHPRVILTDIICAASPILSLLKKD